MGTYLHIQNTQGKDIIVMKLYSEIDEPKGFMKLRDSIYGAGIGLYIPVDSSKMKEVVQYFEAHLIRDNLAKFRKAYKNLGGIDSDRDATRRMAEEYEYWKDATSKLKRAMREHKAIVITCG